MMKRLGAETANRARPVKILQFGEGNFLRGFADAMIDAANETGDFCGDIVLVKPRPGSVQRFREQDCRYTVLLRGLVEGEVRQSHRIVSSIAGTVSPYDEFDEYLGYARLDSLRFILSNTTEAGIVYDETDTPDMRPPKSYPAKLTQFLYERYRCFSGDRGKGLIILPTELIDDNGEVLADCVRRTARRWGLEEAFCQWMDEACTFCSTLVDRIITGYPAAEAEELWDKLGYRDELMVAGEPFALWVIEPEWVRGELPLDRAGQPVLFTGCAAPYRERKMRILNGAHTSFALASYLAGNDTVLESMEDPDVLRYVQGVVYEDVIPTLSLPCAELEDFAAEVFSRFRNPFNHHRLLSISLNSVSKWRARCLPTIESYAGRGEPFSGRLPFSLAALLAFYTGKLQPDGTYLARRGSESYLVQDTPDVLALFDRYSSLDSASYTHRLLSRTELWGRNLCGIPGFEPMVAEYLESIRSQGVRETLREGNGA